MYHSDDFNSNLIPIDLNNRLCCTFFPLSNQEEVFNYIVDNYNILYNKIFILNIKDNEEYAYTYNIDQGNINHLPDNTILVHRKKQTNTLYTINALNELIKSLNNGKLDKNFQINWEEYQNTLLLTQENQLKVLTTLVNKVINL